MMIFGLFTVALLTNSASAFFGADVFDFLMGPEQVQQAYFCDWAATPVPEKIARGHEAICLDNRPYYDQSAIDLALKTHPRARNFLDSVTSMYQPMNETYFNFKRPYLYQDMCHVNAEKVLRVNTKNQQGHPIVCNIVNPHHQNIYRATCGDKCMYGDTPSRGEDFCVPDGYITRYALVFCPSEIVQCRPVQLTVPVGCSCKRYTCKKPAI